uniref:Predicted protein n=1 Tax=Hordeum vulgare subsp. vulgare TaxID=112509 RepID=F2E466_HORVV|nr:predicted protein [Hordeum vulgare subsp. vulgare]
MEKSRGGWASLTSCTEARQRVAVEALEVCSFPTAARREESLLVVLLGGRHGRAVLRSARPSVLPALIGGLSLACSGDGVLRPRIQPTQHSMRNQGSSSAWQIILYT